ncbi:MAG: outer membrane beta-barrel protein [Planctomycetota bacterium]
MVAGALAFAIGGAGLPAVLALDSETFDDYKGVGAAEDARRQPAPLNADGHSIEPSLSWKLLDVLTPHVFAAQTLGYSDNVFHQRTVGTHSPYSRTAVGGRGDICLEDHVFSVGVRAAEGLYFKADRNSEYLETIADARLDLNWNAFRAHADGAYERIYFPAALQLGGQFAREQVYRGEAWAEATWNRVGGKVGLSFRKDDFESTGANLALASADHITIGFDVQANVKVTEKITALVEYDFEAVRFDKDLNRDYDAHQVRAGINGTLGAKLALSIKFGYTYQQVHLSTGNFVDRDRYRGFNAAAALSWQALPQLTFSFTYRRDLTWSIGNNFTTIDSVSAGAVYRFGPAEKLSASGDISFAHSETSGPGSYDVFATGLGFGWKIFKWLDATAFYRYSQGMGSGRQTANEYDEHRVGVSLAVGF